jgi:hypothetical protein
VENKLKVKVLREVEVDFHDLRIGDIFRFPKFVFGNTTVNPDQYNVVKGMHIDNKDPSQSCVETKPVYFIRGMTNNEFYRVRMSPEQAMEEKQCTQNRKPN